MSDFRGAEEEKDEETTHTLFYSVYMWRTLPPPCLHTVLWDLVSSESSWLVQTSHRSFKLQIQTDGVRKQSLKVSTADY